MDVNYLVMFNDSLQVSPKHGRVLDGMWGVPGKTTGSKNHTSQISMQKHLVKGDHGL